MKGNDHNSSKHQNNYHPTLVLCLDESFSMKDLVSHENNMVYMMVYFIFLHFRHFTTSLTQFISVSWCCSAFKNFSTIITKGLVVNFNGFQLVGHVLSLFLHDDTISLRIDSSVENHGSNDDNESFTFNKG